MDDNLRFAAMTVGSFPHKDTRQICQLILEKLPNMPIWPQLPRRSFMENMYVQYSERLPNMVLDAEHAKVTMDTMVDFSEVYTELYENYITENLDYFALSKEYAEGFFGMLDVLDSTKGEWVRGQVTGPISFGLTVVDQGLKPSLYNEFATDAIVKNMTMNARWQIRELKKVRPNVIMFVDEPSMSLFGTAYVSLNREPVVEMLDEVFMAIKQAGALSGVHCCGNTDWSLLMETSANILNLDAYEYIEKLALYPDELRSFLDRGGIIAWGIVPNDEGIFGVTAQQLADRLEAGFAMISEKAVNRGVQIAPEDFYGCSMISPRCGLGPTTVEAAEKVLDVLVELESILQAKL